jgi:glycogen(starch) synthase
MRVLHIVDHSISLHSGYTFRTRASLEQQRAMGWETFPLTSTKQGKIRALVEQVGELAFYRTQPSSEIMERFFGSNIYAN